MVDKKIEAELMAGDELIKRIEGTSEGISDFSKKALVQEIRALQSWHRKRHSKDMKVFLPIGIANLVIGTVMMVFVSPVWGLISYMAFAGCLGAHWFFRSGSERYLRCLQEHKASAKAA